MSDHTPGPWQATGAEPADGVDCWWLIGADRRDIGTINGGQGDATPQANARLIAAAPDLFDALEGMLEMHGSDIEEAAARQKARAAIAKARGHDRGAA